MRLSPKPTATALVVLLLATAAPAAQAGHEEGSLIKCDDDPVTVVNYVLNNAVNILLHILQTYIILASKTKCTAFETLGICQDESLPMTSPFPFSTGGSHPHRGLCWEYPIVPGGGTIACAPGKRIEHRASFDFHTHRCV